MGPHADFVCLSKHCQTEQGEATVYDLPVKATHCPMGHKRLRRIFNAINVASGMARRTDALAAPAIEEALAKRDAARDARNRPATSIRQAPALAVPIGNVAPTLAAMGRQAPMGMATPSAVPATPSLAAIRGRPALPRVPKGGSYNPPKGAMP